MARKKQSCCLSCQWWEPPGDPLPRSEPGLAATWLHSACWPEWHRTRQADAIAALAAMELKNEDF
jgi:hypothetical protein